MKLKMQTGNNKTLIESTITAEGVVLEPQYLSFIRSQGFQVEGIEERHTVASSDGEHSHLVYKVGTYPHPQDSPLLDVGDPEQQIEVWCCSCPDFRFDKSADVRTATTSPDDSGACKHVQEVSKVQRAQNDDSQATLGESE